MYGANKVCVIFHVFILLQQNEEDIIAHLFITNWNYDTMVELMSKLHINPTFHVVIFYYIK